MMVAMVCQELMKSVGSCGSLLLQNIYDEGDDGLKLYDQLS
jgi:hypothetical protein